MSTINDRFRDVLRESGLSQEKFGKPIGMTRSEISNIVYDHTTVKENKISLICAVYGISEDWFRTGEGEMYLPKTVGDQMGELAAGAAKNNVEAIRQIFRELPEKFTDAEILMLYQIFKNHWKD